MLQKLQAVLLYFCSIVDECGTHFAHSFLKPQPLFKHGLLCLMTCLKLSDHSQAIFQNHILHYCCNSIVGRLQSHVRLRSNSASKLYTVAVKTGN